MTKKHFAALAAIFAHARQEILIGTGGVTADPDELWHNLRDDVCAFCADNAPDFDPDRFMEATEGK